MTHNNDTNDIAGEIEKVFEDIYWKRSSLIEAELKIKALLDNCTREAVDTFVGELLPQIGRGQEEYVKARIAVVRGTEQSQPKEEWEGYMSTDDKDGLLSQQDSELRGLVYPRLGGNWTQEHEDEFVKAAQSLIAKAVHGAEANLKADIGYAIGHGRGCGHPITYLEKRYPTLSNTIKAGHGDSK